MEQRFVEHPLSLGVGPSLHWQAASADFMCEGHFTCYIQQMRKVYHARRDALETALTEALGDRAAVRHPTGGLQLIAELPAAIAAESVSALAERQDLTVRPMSIYCQASEPPNALHLGFAPVPEPDIAPAVHRLAGAIDATG